MKLDETLILELAQKVSRRELRISDLNGLDDEDKRAISKASVTLRMITALNYKNMLEMLIKNETLKLNEAIKGFEQWKKRKKELIEKGYKLTLKEVDELNQVVTKLTGAEFKKNVYEQIFLPKAEKQLNATTFAIIMDALAQPFIQLANSL